MMQVPLQFHYELNLQMTQHNVGALVVLKPGDDMLLAGIVTERGNLPSGGALTTVVLIIQYLVC